MIWLAFILHVFLFISLLYITNFKKNYFNPIYFLIYANYFYFFILWILWYFVNKNYIYTNQIGYYITLLFGLGFVLGVLYFKIVVKYIKSLFKYFSKILPASNFEFCSLKTLFIIFSFLFIVLVVFQYITFQTLNPFEVLIQIEAKRQLGIEYQGIIPYIKKPIRLLMDILFCFIVYKSLKYSKKNYIFLSLAMFIYLSIAFGSKSAVIMPLFYLAIIKHNFFKPIKLRIILIWGVIVLFFIATFQLIRLGLFNKLENNFVINIIHTLVGRINMELYLTKYFQEGFNIDYPESLKHFFLYFIPRNILEELGIDKPIPFGLAFTRYLTHRPDVYMTVAGGGIGEWIHNYSIFGISIVNYFAVILGGFFSALLNLFLADFIEYVKKYKKLTKFFIILIFIHIGTLFEFGFSYTVGTWETFITLIFIVFFTNFLFFRKRRVFK